MPTRPEHAAVPARFRRAMLAGVLVLSTSASAQSGVEELAALLDRVPLPEAHHAVEFLYYNGSEEPTQKMELWSGPDWSAAIQSFPRPGLGYLPTEYFHGDLNETWRYNYGTKSATRSGFFGDHSASPFEQSSPMAVVRELSTHPPATAEITHADGKTTATIPVGSSGSRRVVLTFDDPTGVLDRFQQVSQNGTVNSDHRYEDWRPFPSGASIPYQTYVKYISGVAGNPELELTILTTEADELDPAAVPARLGVPADFLVVDEIEGVSRSPDGTVLGPIESGAAPASAVRTTPPGSGLSARTFMLIGVGLILLAGIVLGIRRWRGA